MKFVHCTMTDARAQALLMHLLDDKESSPQSCVHKEGSQEGPSNTNGNNICERLASHA